jgi:hypothetical protein
MINELVKLAESRQLLLFATEHLPVEKYNFIPKGSSNNIIWNMGHLLVTGDSMLYDHSGIPRLIYPIEMARYEKGSRPDHLANSEEIQAIRISLLETLRNYKNAAGFDDKISISTNEIAPTLPLNNRGLLQFLLFHEEMHFRKIRKILQLIEN